MHEMTGGELLARSAALETEAATFLGRILFELSRLELNLGLCLSWVNAGARLEELSKEVEGYNFNAKLEELAKHVESKLPKDSKRHQAYEAWLDRAHKIRRLRNEFVHGRWGVDAPANQVVNVIGLPNSGSQKETRYSISDFAAVNEELRQLQTELSRMREHWPL